MKIVVPMSGTGSRFMKAGYKMPKPLIEVHGKPIIEHVVNLFPGEDDFIFICNEEHLQLTNLRSELNRIKPSGRIVSIAPHKLGPVYAVSKICDLLEDNVPVITTYCDYFMNWDYQDFKNTVERTGCDGAIPSYIGFHPHLLPEKNLYASTLVDADGYMVEIKEKQSYTADKALTPHSAGMYYFSKGSYIKKYFQKLMDDDIALNGEYYISLVYNLLQADGLKTLIYTNVSHFCQWGTPEDLEEYHYWGDIFGKY
jgi:NDP-sugar pyrophosphorylase family protein